MVQIIFYDFCKTQLGTVLVATTELGLCALFIGDKQDRLTEALKDRFKKCDIARDKVNLAPLMKKVSNHLDSLHTKFNHPLDMQGSAFQKKVWKVLSDIPVGKVITYSDIAKTLKMPKAVRAIANACGANPIAIIVPCHRVIRKDKSLAGYHWGIDIKQKLIAIEKNLSS